MAEIDFTFLTSLHPLPDEQRIELLFGNPIVFSGDYLTRVEQELKELPSNEREQLQVDLDWLRQFIAGLKANSIPYPLGFGPVEQLCSRFENGEITQTDAIKLAQDPLVAGNLSQIYVAKLTGWLMSFARSGNTDLPIRFMPILRAAVGAAPQSAETRSMRDTVDFDWVELVHQYLIEAADGRLFRAAVKAGTDMLERTDPATKLYGDVLHILGTLHLDPYSLRDLANYDGEIFRWQHRFFEAHQHELAGISEAEWRMPEAKIALKTAEAYLRKAVPLRADHLKGLSLKALLQALAYEDALKYKQIPSEEIVRLGKEAIAFLDATRDPQQCMTVLATLASYEDVDRTAIEKLFETSLDEYVRRIGPMKTMDLIRQAAMALQKADPHAGLRLIQVGRPLFYQDRFEQQKRSLLRLELVLLYNWLGGELSEKPSGGLLDLAQKTLDHAKKEGCDIRTQAGRLLAVAVIGPNSDEEEAALNVLEEARKLAPLFARDHQDALDCFRADLWLGLGSNAVKAKDRPKAIQMYAMACIFYLDLKLDTTALNCLSRINDLADSPDPNVLNAIGGALAATVRRLEMRLGGEATHLIHALVQRVTSATGPSINPDAMLALWEFDKGFQFAHALYSGTRYGWKEDQRGHYLLQQIRNAEAAASNEPGDDDDGDAADLMSQVTLGAYIGATERQQGNTAKARLLNLQKAYDDHVNERILAETLESSQILINTDDIQAALDEKTVLVYYYVGAKQGSAALHLMLITREDVTGACINMQFPVSVIQMEWKGQTFVTDFIGVMISNFREALLVPPGPSLVSEKAAKVLGNDVRAYFGQQKVLDDLLSKGKDHLCIVPHGALHYYPFHLIGPIGHPLVENWKVTYLPNLHLLMSRRGAPSVKKHRPQLLSVIGLSYTEFNPHHLSALPQSLQEVTAIAAIFATKPIVEERATESVVTGALQTSRFAHLSMHGRHNPSAPAFQCLYVAPDGQNDGILYAHELLTLDLRGLDLVTLSACETALGRFDVGDNLRGLPANLFLGGAATLIGTLWEVSANASELFFTSIYKFLHEGRTRLDAFATAQNITREKFPNYWDWGAFYFAGDWLD